MNNDLKKEDKTLEQKFFVRMDPSLIDMPWKKKVELIDSIGASAGSKALIVDLDFSHTGRRINRRVYSRAGHMMVPGDLTHPYPKPITLNHEDGVQNVIGRIVKAEYVDTEDEAKAYFRKRRLADTGLSQIIEGLTNLDYQKAAAGFHKTKILNDKNWKGIGRVAAKARITDGDAIIKFFDQRYLTFSAEQDSDEYVCSICFQDWYKDGYCGHSPGEMVDGKLAFMMTGKMRGMGSSVVTHPADPDSLVTALSLSDSDGDDDHSKLFNRIIDTFIVDGKSSIEDEQKKEQNMNDLLARFLKGEILSDEETKSLYDLAFSDESIKGKQLTIDDKIVDVSSQKLSDEDLSLLPKSVFVGSFPVPDAAHAIVLDSLIKEYKFDLSEELKTLTDMKFKALGITPEEIEKEIESIQDVFETAKKAFKDNFDKIMTSLSDEEVGLVFKAISDKVESLKLIEVSKEADELKTKVTELTDSVNSLSVKLKDEEKVSVRNNEKAKALSVQYKELLNDHIELAKLLGKTNSETAELTDKVSSLLKAIDHSTNISDKNIKNINLLLDSVDIKTLESKLNDGLQKKTVEPEPDPTVQTKNPENDLTAYEKNVLDRFNMIKDRSGERAAKAYFSSVKQYCSSKFNPLSMEK